MKITHPWRFLLPKPPGHIHPSAHQISKIRRKKKEKEKGGGIKPRTIGEKAVSKESCNCCRALCLLARPLQCTANVEVSRFPGITANDLKACFLLCSYFIPVYYRILCRFFDGLLGNVLLQ